MSTLTRERDAHAMSQRVRELRPAGGNVVETSFGHSSLEPFSSFGESAQPIGLASVAIPSDFKGQRPVHSLPKIIFAEDEVGTLGVAEQYTYPLWLNLISSLVLLLAVAGIALAFWNVMLGAALAALGSLGIWITGSIGPVFRASRNGPDAP